MRSTFRHCVVYLLFVLLPVQAMASLLTHSCANSMSHCHTMKSMDDCCGHGKSLSGSHQLGATTHDGLSHNDSDQHAASCGMHTACGAIAPIAALPSASSVLPVTSSAPPYSFVLPSYTSFISDGLQRPPQILA
jgi:hypothetical protein